MFLSSSESDIFSFKAGEGCHAFTIINYAFVNHC